MSRPAKSALRAARSVCLQILYEIDLARHDPAETMAAHLEESAFEDEALERFVRQLVRGVLDHRVELDPWIAQIAPEWPVEQMAAIDRNILRMALWELLHQPETPVKVAINEAVELARLYGSDGSRRFINGALGTFASKHLKREER